VGTIGRLIFDNLNKDDTTKASLISAFESYFDTIGISNDDDLVIMDADDWPPPDPQTPQIHLKIFVLRCLKTVAVFTKRIRALHFYLRPTVTYEELSDFSTQLDATSKQQSS
jgi:hypothetical protein